MLWFAAYFAIGLFMTYRVATARPRTPGQLAAFLIFALVWPLIAYWQIRERLDDA
jgi:hypothetical protein